MKSRIRIPILALLFVAAYSCAFAQAPAKPDPEPTVAQLKLTVAQQQVTIEEQKAEILKLQALLITSYQQQSDMTLAQAKAKLANEQAAQKPKEQPKK